MPLNQPRPITPVEADASRTTHRLLAGADGSDGEIGDTPIRIGRWETFWRSLRAPFLSLTERIRISPSPHVAAARRRAATALSTLTPSRIAVNLAEHSDYLARQLSAAEADEIAELLGDGDLLGGLERLREITGRRLSPASDLNRIIARAAGTIRLHNSEWRPCPKAPPALSLEKRALLVFHSRGPLINNGYAARSLEILRALATAGWQAQSVTRLGYPADIDRYRGAKTPEIENYGGTPCRRLDDPGVGLRNRPLDEYLAAYEARLAGEIERSRPSVVHAASNYLNGLATVNAARRQGVASVYEARGLWELTALSSGKYDASDIRFQLAARLEASAAQHADAVIAISGGVKDILVERGAAPENITVIPNCVCVNLLCESQRDHKLAQSLGLENDSVIGYFGAFAAYEGIDLLLDSIAALKQKGLSVKGLLAGGGDEEEALKERTRQLNLNDDVIFLGKIPREDISCYMGLADIIALPRRDTPVTRVVPPIKAAEAMARGQALVTSDLPALQEIVTNDRTALTFPAGDAAALASRLETLAVSQPLRKELGRRAATEARARFDVSVAGKLLIEVYDQALVRQ